MKKRLPIYIMVDTSGSMFGEPIESVKSCIETMVTAIRNDPYAAECVYVSVIAFDRSVRLLQPLVSVNHFSLPEIILPKSGPTFTGLALKVLCEQVDNEVSAEFDWKPMLFLMTDGKPSDIKMFQQQAEIVRNKKFSGIFACVAGMTSSSGMMELLTDNVEYTDSFDGFSFMQHIRWE